MRRSIPVEFNWHAPAGERDAFISELAAWWKENREKLDWAELAKKAAKRAAGDE